MSKDHDKKAPPFVGTMAGSSAGLALKVIGHSLTFGMAAKGTWDAARRAVNAYESGTLSGWNFLDVGLNALGMGLSGRAAFTNGRELVGRIARSETGQRIAKGFKQLAADNRGGVDLGGNKRGRYSGGLVKVNSPDAAADALAIRLGGSSRVKFVNDPTGREFDVISSEYIAQAKPNLLGYGKSWRKQTKATFEAAQETGRRAYFQFEGQPDDSVLRKIEEYGERYGVEYIVDITPLGVKN